MLQAKHAPDASPAAARPDTALPQPARVGCSNVLSLHFGATRGKRLTDGLSTSITVDGGRRVTFLDRGPRDGQPVLYLHGMPGSRLEQCLFPDRALARVGVRLISVDRPGWGLTDPLSGDRVARSRDVLAVADHLGIERFPLMAVSAGGSYAVALAATAPSRVARLLLVSAQMPYDDEAAIASLQPDQLALVPAMRLGRVPVVVDGITAYRAEVLEDPVGRFWPSFATLSPAERALVDTTPGREMLIDDIVEGLRASAEGLIEDLLSWPRPLEVDPADIRCPVIAIHGTADDWEPLPNLRRILRQVPSAHLWLCEGTNHFGPLLYPLATLALATDE